MFWRDHERYVYIKESRWERFVVYWSTYAKFQLWYVFKVWLFGLFFSLLVGFYDVFVEWVGGLLGYERVRLIYENDGSLNIITYGDILVYIGHDHNYDPSKINGGRPIIVDNGGGDVTGKKGEEVKDKAGDVGCETLVDNVGLLCTDSSVSVDSAGLVDVAVSDVSVDSVSTL